MTKSAYYKRLLAREIAIAIQELPRTIGQVYMALAMLSTKGVIAANGSLTVSRLFAAIKEHLAPMAMCYEAFRKALDKLVEKGAVKMADKTVEIPAQRRAFGVDGEESKGYFSCPIDLISYEQAEPWYVEVACIHKREGGAKNEHTRMFFHNLLGAELLRRLSNGNISKALSKCRFIKAERVPGQKRDAKKMYMIQFADQHPGEMPAKQVPAVLDVLEQAMTKSKRWIRLALEFGVERTRHLFNSVPAGTTTKAMRAIGHFLFGGPPDNAQDSQDGSCSEKRPASSQQRPTSRKPKNHVSLSQAAHLVEDKQTTQASPDVLAEIRARMQNLEQSGKTQS